MGQFLVKKSQIKGKILIPPSKSHTLRAILFGSLATGKSVIHHYLPSTDTHSMIEACRSLGATIDVSAKHIEIQGLNGKISHAKDVINAGNSGIVLRFCTAIGALASLPVVITGDHSIRHQRPMKQMINGLSHLGVSIESMRGDGYAPLIIKGPIRSGKAIISGEDSQPVSALLIATSFAEGPSDIEVKNPGEKPWISLTLAWLDRLGIAYKNNAFQNFHLPGNAKYEGFEYFVPGDFSTAAFPIAAALITHSELTLENVDMNDSQGDKELIFTFQKMGAKIEINETLKTIHVKKGRPLSGIVVDINNFVDAITTLAVVACFAEGETQIINAAVAKQKECNRINCIATELQKMGADIVETDDGLIIRKSVLRGAHLHSSHDHRMAMSLCIGALGAEGETLVESTMCISKTYPAFLQDFNAIGANIKAI